MAHPFTFRGYQAADYDSVASLWTRINRELAPVGMENLFERYIATIIDGELRQLLEVFSEAKRGAFWVVEYEDGIVGSFGIEGRSATDTELRRMYLDKAYRASGVAQRMLGFAETEARALGYTKLVLSTAQIQKAADRFYRRKRISTGPNRNCRANDHKAGGRRLDPSAFRKGALTGSDSIDAASAARRRAPIQESR